MHMLQSLLLCVLATRAAPAVVIEVVTETVREGVEVAETAVPKTGVIHVEGQEKKQTDLQGVATEVEIGDTVPEKEKKPGNPAAAAAAAPFREGDNGGGGRGNNKNKNKKKKEKGKEAQEEKKYFHEPGWDAESGHYDARYFRGKVAYEEHRRALRRLVRSYLATCAALGVETWLAHGSLLGWWWNGRIMPWDYDLDVQVSVATLTYLGERYNRTLYEYEYDLDEDEVGDHGEGGEKEVDSSSSSPSSFDATPAATAIDVHLESRDDIRGINGRRRSDDKREERLERGALTELSSSSSPPPMTEGKTKTKKTYLLDINPHHGALTRGNGANVIDARWIDTSNGMFIDITGLRERDAERSPGVWSCKNNHRYRTTELWPLRRTEFEGAPAWIPYAFDKVLVDEYGPKSLVTEEWAGHRWIPGLKEWVKIQKQKQQEKPNKHDKESQKEQKKEKGKQKEQQQQQQQQQNPGASTSTLVPKPKPGAKEIHRYVEDKGNGQVVVYEEVVVEV